MGDIKTSDILRATGIDGERLRRLIAASEDAFWECLVAAVPEARTGDMEPMDAGAFSDACEDAVKSWLMANVSRTPPSTGDYSVRVELRRPNVGERGWWIKDDSSPHAALRELMINCPDEPPGFDYDPNLLNKRDRDERDVFDEDGLRLVTVIVGDPIRASSQDELMQAQGFAAPKVGDAFEVAFDLPWARKGERGVVTGIIDGDLTLLFPDRLDNREVTGIYSEFRALRMLPKTPQEIWDGLKGLP